MNNKIFVGEVKRAIAHFIAEVGGNRCTLWIINVDDDKRTHTAYAPARL